MAKWRNLHYKVEIGKDGRVLYCDSWRKAIEWINKMLGASFVCGDDIKYYNETHKVDQVFISYIRDIADYYKRRKEYVLWLRECDDAMQKSQRLPNSPRRDRALIRFSTAYDKCYELIHGHMIIWHGEI